MPVFSLWHLSGWPPNPTHAIFDIIELNSFNLVKHEPAMRQVIYRQKEIFIFVKLIQSLSNYLLELNFNSVVIFRWVGGAEQDVKVIVFRKLYIS